MTRLHHWVAKAILCIGMIVVPITSLLLQEHTAAGQTVVTLHVGGESASDDPGGTEPGES